MLLSRLLGVSPSWPRRLLVVVAVLAWWLVIGRWYGEVVTCTPVGGRWGSRPAGRRDSDRVVRHTVVVVTQCADCWYGRSL